jgi:hypothetical protein
LRFFGVVLDLTGLDLSLEVVEFFDREAVKEVDAALDLKGDLQEMLVLLFLGALEGQRVLDTPMSGHGRAREDRTSLPCIVGKCNDKVEVLIREFMPGIPHRACGVDLEILAKNFQDLRMNVTFGSFARAENLKAIAPCRSEKKFSEDAAFRIASAKKEDVEERTHRAKLFTDTRGDHSPLFESCDKIVTILPLAFWRLIY